MRSGDAPNVFQVLARHAQAEPERTAYTFLHGQDDVEEINRGQLLDAIMARASSLASLTSPGDRVVIAQNPGVEQIITLFACLASGRIAVPTLPPRGERLRPITQALIGDCEPKLVVCDEALDPSGLDGATQALTPEEIDETPGRADWGRGAEIALLQYTSGSTGRPKGVCVTHANLLNNLEHQRRCYGVDESSRGVIWLPPHHDMGLGSGVLQPAYSGSTIVLMSPLWAMQQPVRWLREVSRHGATVSGAPPFAYASCCDSISDSELAELNLSTWRCAFIGAEPIRRDLLDRFAAKFAACGFERRAFVPCYGLAEATLLVSGARLRETDGPSDRPLAECGRVIEDHQLLIVDPGSCTQLADGQEGEIWLSGPSVTAGYWGQSEATHAVFGGRLNDGSGPYLRTGDLGLLDQGRLTITGRIKDVIIYSGRKIHAEDIESTALQVKVSGLRPVAAAAFAVGASGHEHLAIIVEASGVRDEPTRAELRRAVGAAISRDFGLSVGEFDLARPGSLPRTSSGKIRRAACREELAARMERSAAPDMKSRTTKYGAGR